MNPQQHSSGELVLDSEQLGRIIHTYQGNHRMAASHADQLLGLASGPGARFRAAVEVANARLPRVLHSQLSQWERLCGDILLFSDATRSHDNTTATILSPTVAPQEIAS